MFRALRSSSRSAWSYVARSRCAAPPSCYSGTRAGGPLLPGHSFPPVSQKKAGCGPDRASKLGRQSCRQQCQSTLVDGKVVFDNARFPLIKRLWYHMAWTTYSLWWFMKGDLRLCAASLFSCVHKYILYDPDSIDGHRTDQSPLLRFLSALRVSFLEHSFRVYHTAMSRL